MPPPSLRAAWDIRGTRGAFCGGGSFPGIAGIDLQRGTSGALSKALAFLLNDSHSIMPAYQINLRSDPHGEAHLMAKTLMRYNRWVDRAERSAMYVVR